MTGPEWMTDNPQLAIRHRQTLFDVANNAAEVATAVGLPPISDEVAEMERRDSKIRLVKIARFEPAATDHSQWLAAIFTFSHRGAAVMNGVTDVPDAVWEKHCEDIQHMVLAGGMSLLSLLVDIGAVHIDEAWKMPEAPAEQEPEDGHDDR